MSFKSEKGKQDASSLTNWTSATLGHLALLVWGALCDYPEPAPPAVLLLSGRRPRHAGTHTYHIERPAALLDAVCVEHHSGPSENSQIC